MWWIQQTLETFKSWLRQSEWLHIVKIRHLNDLEVFEFCILHIVHVENTAYFCSVIC